MRDLAEAMEVALERGGAVAVSRDHRVVETVEDRVDLHHFESLRDLTAGIGGRELVGPDRAVRVEARLCVK